MTGHSPGTGRGVPAVDVVAWAVSTGAASGPDLADRIQQHMVVLSRVVATMEGTRPALDGPDDVVADAIRQTLWHLDRLIGRLAVIRGVADQETGS